MILHILCYVVTVMPSIDKPLCFQWLALDTSLMQRSSNLSTSQSARHMTNQCNSTAARLPH